MWSPYFISVAIVLSCFDISWLELFPYGLALALVGMVMGMIAQGKNSQPIVINQDPVDEQTLKNAQRKVAQLLTLIVTMTGDHHLTRTVRQFIDDYDRSTCCYWIFNSVGIVLLITKTIC